MSILICPVCHNPLAEESSRFFCAQHHTFDKSRHGYVNLLLSHMKHSKEPGDNKDMVRSRDHFLNQGHYAAISHLLSKQVNELFSTAEPESHIADLGCGTGYYLKNLKETLDLTQQNNIHYWGVDIAKDAIHLAAKTTKDIHWIVSNISQLPFAADSLHSIVSLFSPIHFTEFNRVLTDNGYLFVIYPATHHLDELRHILFSDVKQINPERLLKDSTPHFNVKQQIPLTYSISLNSSAEIANLFKMTPYFWRCTPEKKQQVLALSHFELTIDVMLWVLQKKS
jgi:23S rRNA (guanine745-N1)-methyltransferase